MKLGKKKIQGINGAQKETRKAKESGSQASSQKLKLFTEIPKQMK